ncbi:4-carboxymuconolactone decarboxylase [Actinomyces denticolens]|uniref:4-carboxymuconolactone decarboxylase n=1 Tax=Actinomyces denticolens TaxID=52767 RepID=A0ABY1I931_9ACTO|nr:carboxymuconolactone decarboxylase family protein [Actinomyces denticolens]SHI79450.1 4-carboxymuconolactone decarboxylase [Actinomyces denticolens]
MTRNETTSTARTATISPVGAGRADGAASAAPAAAAAVPQDDINTPEALARRDRGLEVMRMIDGEQGRAVIESLADISPALGHHILAYGFGDVYSRPGLDARSRQLVTLGMLAALGGCEPQLKVHIGAALNVGITREEIVEAFLHASGYCGFPRALNATFVAREVFRERDAQAGAAPEATGTTGA